MIPVTESPISEYFDEVSSDLQNAVWWLNESECKSVWSVWGASVSRGLYDLPSGHWLNAIAWQPIANWLGELRGMCERGLLVQKICESSGWSVDAHLMLIQGSQRIISLNLGAFAACWDCLLRAFDDGPVLVPGDVRYGSVFCFAPLGQVLHATKV